MSKVKKTIKLPLPFYKRWSTYLYAISLSLLIFLTYIIFRIQISERKLITLSFIPILLGIIYEHRRLSTAWQIIALKILGALILSFFAFLPGKNESNYDFENHIENWPFYFLVIFVIISVLIHDKKVVTKLTEGITLVQSISIIYWIFDHNIFDNLNLFTLIILILSFLISIYSLVHAFTYTPLSRNHRLYLSIWSSIIMIVFAVENIFNVFSNDNIENVDATNAMIITVQYFMLGVSSMYILQNFFMLIEYLPGKQRFYNKQHLQDIKQMNKTHINRYSDKQVLKIDSLICIIYCLLVYYMNYKLQIFHRQTVIWIVIISVPYILFLKEKFVNRKKNTIN